MNKHERQEATSLRRRIRSAVELARRGNRLIAEVDRTLRQSQTYIRRLQRQWRLVVGPYRPPRRRGVRR